MPTDLDNIKRSVESHHKRLIEIDRQISELQQERGMLKAAAIRDLHENLRLGPELIGHLVAACR